jgi:hypothetical protein
VSYIRYSTKVKLKTIEMAKEHRSYKNVFFKKKISRKFFLSKYTLFTENRPLTSPSTSVAEPHFYAAPAPGKNFYAAQAPAASAPAPAPTLLYSKTKFLKRTKV